MSDTIQYNTDNLEEDSTYFSKLTEELDKYKGWKAFETIEDGNGGEIRNGFFQLFNDSEIVVKTFTRLVGATEVFLKKTGIALTEMDRQISQEIEK
ncbi:MAG: hypothetical protein PUF01_02910 [Eubacteriales bacterium]|nr:hypothetical protein [Eubacteriales bacterium]